MHPQRLVSHRAETLAARNVSEAMFGATFTRRLEDLVVHDQHDQHGDVESDGCGVDGVAEVLADEAHAGCVHVFGPAAERWQRDGGRRQPHAQDHLRHQLTVLPRRIGERPRDAQISEGRGDRRTSVTTFTVLHLYYI